MGGGEGGGGEFGMSPRKQSGCLLYRSVDISCLLNAVNPFKDANQLDLKIHFAPRSQHTPSRL